MNQPAPFSANLTKLLDEPWADRQAVHDWLGNPHLTRQSGRIEVYVGQQEIMRNLPHFSDAENVYHYHYLVIEYTDEDSVLGHHVLVNAGCTPDGLCIYQLGCTISGQCPGGAIPGSPKDENRQDTESPNNGTPSAGYRSLSHGSAEELLAAKVEEVVVYATTADDAAARKQVPDGDCLFYLHSAGAPPLVRVGMDTLPVANLGEVGYLVWRLPAGTHQVHFEWGSWLGKYQEETLDQACNPGDVLVLSSVFEKQGWNLFDPRYDMEIIDLPASEGLPGIRWKRLILQ